MWMLSTLVDLPSCLLGKYLIFTLKQEILKDCLEVSEMADQQMYRFVSLCTLCLVLFWLLPEC